jgi:hypothetical protein
MCTFTNCVHRPTCGGADENVDICSCDPQCARYGDCCRSSPYFVPEEQRLGAYPFTCMELHDLPMNVMAQCPPDWTDSDTRYRCEHPDTSYRDPLLDAPVKSSSTNITYRNWHCASCHGDLDADTTVFWNAGVICYSEYGMRVPLVSTENFTKYLLYNTSHRNLNIDISDLDNDPGISSRENPLQSTEQGRKHVQQKSKYSCNLYYIPQVEELETIRYCKTGVISHCSPGWNGTEEQKLCEGYTARVCSGYNTYRNYHCLLCNDFTVSNPCLPSSYGFPLKPFSMLLNWNTLKRSECAKSQVYDPLSRVCRKVFT